MEFEKRKKEYFNIINDNLDVLDRIICDNSKNEKNKKTVEILLNPKNEKELLVAEMLFTMTCDLLNLHEDIQFNEVKLINNENNFALQMYIQIIKKMKSNKEKEIEEIKNNLSYKESARIMYEYMVSYMNDREDMINYIANSSGFSLDDEIELRCFNYYFEKTCAIMNQNNLTSMEFSECTLEDIKKGKMLTNEFHRLCEEGKINSKQKTRI